MQFTSLLNYLKPPEADRSPGSNSGTLLENDDAVTLVSSDEASFTDKTTALPPGLTMGTSSSPPPFDATPWKALQALATLVTTEATGMLDVNSHSSCNGNSVHVPHTMIKGDNSSHWHKHLPFFVYEQLTERLDIAPILIRDKSPFAECRRQYVKVYHIIGVTKQQLLVTSDAHKTPHYSISVKEFIIYLDYFRTMPENEKPVLMFYDRTQSYTCNENFIRVWNEGTEEFASIQRLMEGMDFSRALKVLNVYLDTMGKNPTSRGNRFVSVGYSTMDITEKDSNCLNGPAITKKTRDFIPQMVALSKLLSMNWPVDQNSDRLQFARKIHNNNLLEGFTCATTFMGEYNQEQMHFDATKQQQILCHCDDRNCKSAGNNYLIIASQVQDGRDDGIVRIAAIGYARKSVLDYMNCTLQLAPLMYKIELAVQSSTIKKEYDTRDFRFQTEYVKCLVELKTMFQLTIRTVAELIYPLAVLNDDCYFEYMCCEVKRWIKYKIIPRVQHYGIHLLWQCERISPKYTGLQNCKEACDLIQYILTSCYKKRATTKMSVIKEIQEHSISLLLTKFYISTSQVILKTIGYLCNNLLLAELSVFSRYSPLYLAIPEVLHIEKQHAIKLLRGVREKHHLSVVETEKLVSDVLLSDEINQVRRVSNKLRQRKLSRIKDYKEKTWKSGQRRYYTVQPSPVHVSATSSIEVTMYKEHCAF